MTETSTSTLKPSAAGTEVTPLARLVPVDSIQFNPANVRPPRPIPELVEALKDEGVSALISYVTVRTNKDGGYTLIDGHGRTASFIEAGMKVIPAVIREDQAGKTQEIVAMLRTGTQGDKLTGRQHANGLVQLTLAGMDTKAIAKKTGVKKDTVDKAIKAAKLGDDVTSRAESHGLDLFQVAALAEFAEDEDIIDDLLTEAESGPFDFDRAVIGYRNDRIIAEMVTARVEELGKEGVTVLTETSLDRTKATELWYLADAEGKRFTPETHEKCPGRAVSVRGGHTPEDALREVWFCADWRQYDHTNPMGVTATVKRSMTDEEKADRKKVVTNNKAMAAANEARRAWLTTKLKSKDLKAEAARFVAETLTEHHQVITTAHHSSSDLLKQFLGVKSDRVTVSKQATAARATVISLAAIAAAYESRINKDAWRNPTPDARRWLTFLTATLGYKPGEVEKLIISQS